MQKTNAMRLLTQAGISFSTVEYEVDENDLSGEHVAAQLGQDCAQVFKTLTARGDKTGPLVFCIPVACELDLKKAAKASGNKKVELIHVRELLALTGYVRGGCSPVGMKKKFPTFIDETMGMFDDIFISAGVRGVQLHLAPGDLIAYVEAQVCDLIEL